MESGYLVIRRQGNGKGDDCTGVVRRVEDDSAVVQWPEGQLTRIPLPVPSDITVVPLGSLHYRSLSSCCLSEREICVSAVQA
ncbi:hypothetical protein [Streptomyces mirabilis]|uniref:hypothetical protein n=1 Tax=Streptomyces mirabilis TaxID=68239 RepID=UPI0036DDC6E9